MALGKMFGFFGRTGDENPNAVRDLQLKMGKRAGKKIKEIESRDVIDKGDMIDSANVSTDLGAATAQAMQTGEGFDPNQARAMGDVAANTAASSSKNILDAIRAGKASQLRNQYSFFTTTGNSAFQQAANERDAGMKGLGAVMEGLSSLIA
ncbi:MAG: hypothetical protein Unbinned80contig1000_6 [Prokaryotic dsDNA virus sp.]|nr:MAG: hypothetical protein Unbinned80contig1000_6 [Prokaryotic dsDNA virus sp.]|tara:strand:- start:109 stop:561 length:453 start_codon:yes stop_codon:yes gene_type:complete